MEENDNLVVTLSDNTKYTSLQVEKTQSNYL